MKRLLLLLCTALFTLGGYAEVSSPYKGCEVGTMKDVYLYNISTGMWLQTNRRDPGFWTTRAQLDVSGKDVDITAYNGGWQINPKQGANHSMNDFNLYFDTSQPVTAWTFTQVETTDGSFVYTITSGSYALGARNVNGSDGKPLITNLESNFIADGGQWQIVTREERLQMLATASETEPQDASWMIKGYDFAANDERNTAWQGLSGDYAIVADNKVNCNRLLEVWNLTNKDVYQEIAVPNGIYEVWANGCYSPTGASDLSLAHKTAYENGTEPVCGYIYANDEMVPMVDMYAEAQSAKVTNCMEKQIGSYWIPAGNGQVSASFFNGYYRPQSFRISVVDEKIRIGAKVIDGTGTSWMLVDNFTLTYLGNEGSAFKGHITPTPADNAAIDFDDMGSMKLRFDGAVSVAIDENSTFALTIKDAEGEPLAHADINNVEIERNTLIVSPVLDVINYGGLAIVNVSGSINVDGEEFVIGTDEEPFTFAWNVKEKVLPYIPTFTLNPDNQYEVRKSQLGNITITFPEAESVNFDIDALAKLYGGNSAGGGYADKGNEPTLSDAFFNEWSQQGNSITMSFAHLALTEGAARLFICGGSIIVDGRKVDDIEVVYALSSDVEECEYLNVADAVDAEGRLAVEPANSAFTIVYANPESITRVFKATGEPVGIALPTLTDTGYLLTIYTFEDVYMTKGTYTLTLAEGLFSLTDGTETHPSARKEHSFTVGDGVRFSPLNTTSISNIHTTSTDVYYNLNGQRISQPQRGINIINGKKIIR